MSDLDISVQQVGQPLGSMVLTASGKTVGATLVNRVTATIEVAAYASDVATDFQWSSDNATFARAQAGVLRLPVINGQVWYFKEGVTAGSTLQVTCAG